MSTPSFDKVFLFYVYIDGVDIPCAAASFVANADTSGELTLVAARSDQSQLTDWHFSPLQYDVKVVQMDREGCPLREYEFRRCVPKQLSTGWDAAAQGVTIESLVITFKRLRVLP